MKRRQFLTTTAGAAGVMLTGLARGQTKPCPPSTLSVQGGSSATTTCTTQNQTGAPAWFLEQRHERWTTPVSNWLGASDVKDPLATTAPNSGTTGHAAIITAWTGMGADQTRKMIWMAGNGGHADYAGNEVYSCDLNVDSPAWIRRRNASPAPSNNQQVWTKWADATPPADHSGMHQVAAEGRWFRLSPEAPNWLGPARRDSGLANQSGHEHLDRSVQHLDCRHVRNYWLRGVRSDQSPADQDQGNGQPSSSVRRSRHYGDGADGWQRHQDRAASSSRPSTPRIASCSGARVTIRNLSSFSISTTRLLAGPRFRCRATHLRSRTPSIGIPRAVRSSPGMGVAASAS